jgi:hypothetical protein
MGGSALPAKAYHFVGSAINSCLLRSKAFTAAGAIVVNPIAARAYRAHILVSRVEASLPKELKDFDFEGLTESRLAPIVEAFNSIPPDTRPMQQKAGFTLEQVKFFGDPRNALHHLFPKLEPGEKLTTQRAFAGILTNLAKYDAAKLARDWWEKRNLPIVGHVYLPTLRHRPEVRDASISPLFNFSERDRCEQPGWSKARCGRAIAVLESWEIDFKWTQQQHYKGALFGWHNCRRLDRGESMESLACQALRKRGGDGSADAIR